ncbi:metallophosphoesterase [Paenibacillus sp. N1-5-1-14]|uniref:metallophosphoesterase family protein n=1 Tax=Paenibacillus radicibacter TaxID=2972488 RepID=UPI002158F937|nr:metallophosphoesterase [Paenibacillus radicibacter]MCR8645333.1 metallophosphoesterase [Paenibacillus radicibacter]
MVQRSFIRRPFVVVLVGIIIVSAFFLIRSLQGSVGQGNLSSALPPKPQAEVVPTATPTKAPGDPLLSFFILSDIHVSAGIPAYSNQLKKALDDIKSFKDPVEAIMLTGDVTDTGAPGDYKEYKKIMSQYKLPPIYANMGNHDYYNVWLDKDGQWSQKTFPNGKTDAMAREAFMSLFNLEKPYHDANLNGLPFILLSQEAYVQEKPEVGEGAWYSDEQMNWFKSKIDASKGKPVFVMIHQELPAKGQDGGTHRLIRAKQFREIVKSNPNVFIFSGHTHQDLENDREHYIKETFHWFKNSSVSRVLNTKYEQARKTSSQGLYVQVYEDKVVVRGREFSDRTWIDKANWTVKLTK